MAFGSMQAGIVVRHFCFCAEVDVAGRVDDVESAPARCGFSLGHKPKWGHAPNEVRCGALMPSG